MDLLLRIQIGNLATLRRRPSLRLAGYKSEVNELKILTFWYRSHIYQPDKW